MHGLAYPFCPDEPMILAYEEFGSAETPPTELRPTRVTEALLS